jgi:hypothetical protein
VEARGLTVKEDGGASSNTSAYIFDNMELTKLTHGLVCGK